MQKQHGHVTWRHGNAAWTSCMDMKHEQAARTCSMETWTYISLCIIQQGSSTSSMDMHHGDMDMHNGHAARICSMNKQHGDIDIHHGRAAWTSSMDKQQEQTSWTFSMGMQHGHASSKSSMDMQNENEPWRH
jgi:hypothetical protein